MLSHRQHWDGLSTTDACSAATHTTLHEQHSFGWHKCRCHLAEWPLCKHLASRQGCSADICPKLTSGMLPQQTEVLTCGCETTALAICSICIPLACRKSTLSCINCVLYVSTLGCLQNTTEVIRPCSTYSAIFHSCMQCQTYCTACSYSVSSTSCH